MIINFYKRGITVIEMLAVLAILILLMLVILPSFNTIKQMNVLKSSVSDVSSTLDKARSQTLASLNSSEYGVHFQSDEVVLFKGRVYASNDPSNVIINITSPATISTISLTDGVSDLYFNRLSGAPNITGTVILSIIGNNSLTKTLTISATGAVSQN